MNRQSFLFAIVHEVSAKWTNNITSGRSVVQGDGASLVLKGVLSIPFFSDFSIRKSIETGFRRKLLGKGNLYGLIMNKIGFTE